MTLDSVLETRKVPERLLEPIELFKTLDIGVQLPFTVEGFLAALKMDESRRLAEKVDLQSLLELTQIQKELQLQKATKYLTEQYAITNPGDPDALNEALLQVENFISTRYAGREVTLKGYIKGVGAATFVSDISGFVVEKAKAFSEWLAELPPLVFENIFGFEQCFPAGTPITLADGSTKLIEHIRHGDTVLSHDKLGNLTPQIVDKLFTNTTDAFIRLSFTDRDDLIATPGHHFLTETGDYMEIGHLARLGGGQVRIVDTDGSIVTATAERITYSAETADMFEQAAAKTIAYSGNNILQEDRTQGWKTYNFEVRETHTYIAGGIRVHNKSVLDFLEPHERANLKGVEDTDNDGKLDFAVVDIENGNIEYEVSLRDGANNSLQTVREMTAYDKNGNLYYKQFIKNEKGEFEVKNISLTGQQLGENIGKSLTPFFAQSFIDKDDSVYERVAVNTVIDTLVGNLGEIIGALTHRAGVDYGSFSVFENLDDISDATLLDLGGDLTLSGVNSSLSIINELLIAEIFEGVELDGVDGAVLK